MQAMQIGPPTFLVDPSSITEPLAYGSLGGASLLLSFLVCVRLRLRARSSSLALPHRPHRCHAYYLPTVRSVGLCAPGKKERKKKDVDGVPWRGM